jgi:hypothetical protein
MSVKLTLSHQGRVYEYSAEDNIWTQEEGSGERLEESA